MNWSCEWLGEGNKKGKEGKGGKKELFASFALFASTTALLAGGNF
jgi:hypothetical protein